MLEVPVGMFVTDRHTLLTVGGGRVQEMQLPVRPFKTKECGPTAQGAERVQLIGMNEPSTYIYKDYLNGLPITTGPDGRKRIDSDYVLDLVKEFPDVIHQVTGSKIEPYPIFVDIETADSLKYENGEILSIQIGYVDVEDVIILIQDGDSVTESDIIKQFISYCIKSPTGKTPDIMVTYNGNRFDIPYLMGRARINKLMALWHTMDRTDAHVFNPFWIKAAKADEMIEVAKGFLSYDLYLHAKADLTLQKLPGRTLKNVAAFYGSKDVIDIDKKKKMSMREFLKNEPQRFIEYAISDIRQTKYLWNIYSVRTIAEANLLVVPFMMAHRMSSGQKSYVALYRETRKNGFYSFKKNYDRYGDLYERAEKYQGALVGSWGHGYYDKIIYVDCRAMYPNNMHDFNLSPDRYKLLDIVPYDNDDEPHQIKAEGPADARIIYIPDDNYRVTFKFQVNLINDGYLRHLINYYNDIRQDYKKRSKVFSKSDKHEDKVQYLMYDSMQMAAKVINNTYYGLNGNKYYEIGDLPQAIFVTAVGRWLMTEMIKYFGGTVDIPRNDGSYSDTVLEVDTDGLLLDRSKFNVSIEEVNKYMRDKIHEFFLVPHDKMNFELEFENNGSIYLYKRKNYILKTELDPDKLTIKGSAFVGYDKAPIIHRAVKTMADCVMYKRMSYEEACRKCRDISGPLDDFLMTKVLSRAPEEYRGYDDVDFHVKSLDMGGANSKILSKMKKRTKEWIENKFPEGEQRKMIKRILSEAENEDEINMVLDLIREATGSSTGARYFILELVMQLFNKGVPVNEDTAIEYYWAKCPSGYMIADDVKEKSQLDIERYLTEINNIIDRFEYADPVRDELTLFKM